MTRWHDSEDEDTQLNGGLYHGNGRGDEHIIEFGDVFVADKNYDDDYYETAEEH